MAGLSEKRRRTDSRERLLEAAARVFAERGYSGASVDDIAAEAGLSKGAVYWNFDSKDDLFHSLVEERIDRRIRDMIEYTEQAPADETTAGGVNRRFLDLIEEERELVLLAHEYWALAMRDPALRARYAERSALLRAALADALAARAGQLGAPPFDLSAEEVATAYIALGTGLSILKLADPDSVPERLYGEVLSLVYEGLVARAQISG